MRNYFKTTNFVETDACTRKNPVHDKMNKIPITRKFPRTISTVAKNRTAKYPPHSFN